MKTAKGRKRGGDNSDDYGVDHILKSWQRERPDLSFDTLLLEGFIVRLARVIEVAHARNLQSVYGLSISEGRVLLTLRRAGPPYAQRPTDLFKSLLVTSGAITKILDRLEAAGLVERFPDATNRGGFLAHLTAKGFKIADRHLTDFATNPPLDWVWTQFSASEKGEVFRFLLKALSAIEKGEDHADAGTAERPVTPARPRPVARPPAKPARRRRASGA